MTGVDQRRHLVLLFTDLTDSTRIAAQMEPELYAELLHELRVQTGAAVARHGGEIVRIDGDGALCIFGYPVAHEDAGRRATEAALDLHAAVAASALGRAGGISMHSGIHAGVVLLRSGDMVRGRYEMLGDATNVAAKLCDAAGAGGILASDGTLGRDRHFFRTAERREIALPGHDAALAVWPVLGRADLPHRYAARTHDGLTPFSGRHAERARLARWLDPNPDPVAGPVPPLMLLHGPAGIGKTRLLGEAAADAARVGWRVASGFCEAYLGARPLQPFLQLAAGLQPAGPGEAGDLVEDFAASLSQTASHGPLLLVIDDWQWADDASLELLASLGAGNVARDAADVRVLLASREDRTRLALDLPADRIALPPLDRATTGTTIKALLGSPDPFVVERIEAAAGGSPLLIEELCHAFAAGGVEAAPGGDPRGAWFDLAVQARSALLPAAEAALLRLAAVIGNRVPAWLLAAVRGEALDPALLDRLQAADFLFPADSGDGWRFKHGLTRDAVYTGIGLAERRALHGRVLAALEARAADGEEAPLLDALAYHSGAAGRRETALPFAIRAGDAALVAGALDRAQAHYRAALDLVETMAEGAERLDLAWMLLNKFGLASIVDPAPDQVPTLERARALLRAGGDGAGEVRGAYWLGAIAYGIGQGKRSVAWFEEALALAHAHGQHRLVEQIRIKLAQSRFAAGDLASAATQFAELLPAIRAVGSLNDREAAAYALSCYGFLHAEQGDFATAAAYFAEGEAVLRDSSRPMTASLLTQQAASCLWRGDWPGALALTGGIMAGGHRVRYQTMIGRAIAAYAAWQIDRDSEAAASLEAAAQWFLAPGHSRQRASLVFGWLADVMAANGDRTGARFHARQALRRVREGGDRLGEAMAWRALARIEREAGALDRAAHYAALALRSAEQRGSRHETAQAWLCEAEIARARGDEPRARARAEAAAAAFAAMAMPWFAARAEAFLTSR